MSTKLISVRVPEDLLKRFDEKSGNKTKVVIEALENFVKASNQKEPVYTNAIQPVYTPKNELAKSKTPLVIAAYVQAFQKRYGTKARPDLGGKSVGCLNRVIKDYGPEKSAIIVGAFLEMDDEWFKKKCHDLVTLEQNVHKVILALSTGNKNPSSKQKGIAELLEDEYGSV